MSVVATALTLALSDFMLSGCAQIQSRFGAVAQAESTSDFVQESNAAPAHPDVKTVRPRGTRQALPSDISSNEQNAVPIVVASAVPSPQQIFDFHPSGSAPGSFRQPFIIDPNDGPLTADVRKTAAELKAFNAAMTSGTAVAGNKPCGEDEVAHDKPGCSGVRRKVAATVSRDPLALQ